MLTGLVGKAVYGLCAAVCLIIIVGLMLFYRSEAQDAQKALQETTAELVRVEEKMDSFIAESKYIQAKVADGQKAKVAAGSKTNASIKVVETKGVRSPLDGDSIGQLQLRSRQVREAALDNASGAN